MLKKETLIGRITQFDRDANMIDMKTDDGREFSLPRILLLACGFDYATDLRVGDRIEFVAKPIVSYRVTRVRNLVPGPRLVAGGE